MPDDGAQGAPNPDPGVLPPEAVDLAAEIERLKQENADLRDGRRADRAEAAKAKYGLDDETAELLKTVPADQIDERASKIAAARGQVGPSSQVGPTNPTPPSDGGLDPATQAAMSQMQQQGQPTPTEPQTSLADKMAAEVKEAKSLAEVTEIQSRYIQIANETGDQSLFSHS